MIYGGVVHWEITFNEIDSITLSSVSDEFIIHVDKDADEWMSS